MAASRPVFFGRAQHFTTAATTQQRGLAQNSRGVSRPIRMWVLYCAASRPTFGVWPFVCLHRGRRHRRRRANRLQSTTSAQQQTKGEKRRNTQHFSYNHATDNVIRLNAACRSLFRTDGLGSSSGATRPRDWYACVCVRLCATTTMQGIVIDAQQPQPHNRTCAQALSPKLTANGWWWWWWRRRNTTMHIRGECTSRVAIAIIVARHQCPRC